MPRTIKFSDVRAALSTMHQCIANSPPDQRNSDLQEIVVTAHKQDGHKPCWITIGNVSHEMARSTEELSKVTGAPATMPAEDSDLMQFPLSACSDQAELTMGPSTPDKLLVVLERSAERGPDAMLNIMRELAWHDDIVQECCIMKRCSDNAQMNAIMLTVPRRFSAHSIMGLEGCRILNLFAGSPHHAWPPDFQHRIVQDYPDFIPRAPANQIRIWSTETTRGKWIDHEVLPESVININDRLVTVDELVKTPLQEVKHFVDPPLMPVVIKPETRAPKSRPRISAVVLSIESPPGTLDKQVLDILDRVEFREGGYSNARIYSQKTGMSTLAPMRHYIRFDCEEQPNLISSGRMRCYVQPKTFADNGIPLFLEEGYTFSPDLQNILHYLPDGHRLITQLIESFPSDEDAVHLLEYKGQTKPLRRRIHGGSLLHERIDRIILQEALQSESEGAPSPDLLASKEISNKLVLRREKWREGIRRTGAKERESFIGEVKSFTEEMKKQLGQVESELKPIPPKIDQLKSLVAELDKTCKETPDKWWDICDSVAKINKAIAGPRQIWIKDTNETFDSKSLEISETIKTIKDIRKLTNARKKELADLLKTAVNNSDLLEKAIQAGSTSGEDIDKRVANTVKQHNKSVALLKGFDAKLNDEFKRLDEVRKDLEAEQARLDERKSKLQLEEERIANREASLSIQRNTLEARQNALKTREREANDEATTLEHMQNVIIPDLDSRASSAEIRLDRIDKEKLELRKSQATVTAEKAEALLRKWQDKEESVRQQYERAEAGMKVALTQKTKAEQADAKARELEDQIKKRIQETEDLQQKTAERRRNTKGLKAKLRNFGRWWGKNQGNEK